MPAELTKVGIGSFQLIQRLVDPSTNDEPFIQSHRTVTPTAGEPAGNARQDEQFRQWLLTCSSAMAYQGIVEIAPVYALYFDRYRSVLDQYLNVLNLNPGYGIVVFQPSPPTDSLQSLLQATSGVPRNRIEDNFWGVVPSQQPAIASSASISLEPEFVLDEFSTASPEAIVGKALHAGSLEAAFDILFEEFDDMFQAKCFQEVDQALLQLPIENYSTDIIAGIVASIRPARESLPSWQTFLAKSRKWVEIKDPANLVVLNGF
jgi:hypothetical protein